MCPDFRFSHFLRVLSNSLKQKVTKREQHVQQNAGRQEKRKYEWSKKVILKCIATPQASLFIKSIGKSADKQWAALGFYRDRLALIDPLGKRCSQRG